MYLRTGVPELIVALDAAPELYTVLYTIVVCGVGFFFRGFRPSTSAILSLTAFAVKSLSLKSDIRFRASCTEADDGVDTDVIRAVCRGCSVTLLQYMLSSTRFCLRPASRIPTIVCKSSCLRFHEEKQQNLTVSRRE